VHDSRGVELRNLMAKRKYNLSPAGRAVLVETARRLNADPAAKAERMRQQMADPEFRKRRAEGIRKAVEGDGVNSPKPFGRPRKQKPSFAADSAG
jgi:hypothetical protein